MSRQLDTRLRALEGGKDDSASLLAEWLRSIDQGDDAQTQALGERFVANRGVQRHVDAALLALD